MLLRTTRAKLRLGACLALGLMWTAIERFLYPQRTSTILAIHPDIAAGFPIPAVVVIAGFVESHGHVGPRGLRRPPPRPGRPA